MKKKSVQTIKMLSVFYFTRPKLRHDILLSQRMFQLKIALLRQENARQS